MEVTKMKSIHQYNFHKTKYGEELLIDVMELSFVQKFIRKTPIHRLTYYDITFITEGKSQIMINNNEYNIEAGQAICSIPGEVWRWNKNNNLKGYTLVFEEEFLLSFFYDTYFLQKFAYLHSERTSAVLIIEHELFKRIILLINQMKEEINNRIEKDNHIFRAMLYEVLILLNRAHNDTPIVRYSYKNDITKHHLNSFIKLVDTKFIEERNIQYYADKLCITPNYLNKIIQKNLGINSKQYIQNKTIQEAKNLLNHTTLSISQIADKLHFNTLSYFIRFFFKNMGITPNQYRKQSHEK